MVLWVKNLWKHFSVNCSRNIHCSTGPSFWMAQRFLKCFRILICEIKLDWLFDGSEVWGEGGHWCLKPNDPWSFHIRERFWRHFLARGAGVSLVDINTWVLWSQVSWSWGTSGSLSITFLQKVLQVQLYLEVTIMGKLSLLFSMSVALPFTKLFFFLKKFHFWPCWVFIAAHGFSLVGQVGAAL